MQACSEPQQIERKSKSLQRVTEAPGWLLCWWLAGIMKDGIGQPKLRAGAILCCWLAGFGGWKMLKGKDVSNQALPDQQPYTTKTASPKMARSKQPLSQGLRHFYDIRVVQQLLSNNLLSGYHQNNCMLCWFYLTLLLLRL